MQPLACEELRELDGEDDSLLESILGALQACHIIPLPGQDHGSALLSHTRMPRGRLAGVIMPSPPQWDA